jgi:hypothetical protein
MLAIALFVGAGAFALACVRSVTRTLDRSQTRQEAVDLARSKMTELETGVTNLNALRGEFSGAIGSRQRSSEVDEATAPSRWRLDVAVSRSEFTGLSLVELTVSEAITPEAEAAGATAMRYTLRQLVSLRDDPGEAWDEDELLTDLPAGGEGAE